MSTTAPVSIAPPALQSRPEGRQYAPLPDKSDDGFVTGHAVQTILADSESLFALWSDLSTIPLWQERVLSVTPLGENRSHWVLGNTDDPNSKQIEFDSEVTESIPGKKIAWQSIDSDRGGNSDVYQRGEVTFAPGRLEGSTEVTLIQTVKMPSGVFGNLFASVGERGPKQLIIENLRHFKQLAEAGEIPSVRDQPHGPRGAFGGIKRWLYGETNPTPPGTSAPTVPTGKDERSVSKP